MIQEVFDQKFNDINTRFIKLTSNYQFMRSEIGEVKMNHFILDKWSYQNKIKDKTIKIILYPVSLLIVLFFLLVIFDIYIIPGLFDVMMMFDHNLGLITIFSLFVRFIIVLYFFILIVIFTLMYQINKRPFAFYLFLYNKGYLQFIINHFSMQFANYYLILLQQGINTKQCFDLLSNLKNNEILLSIIKRCVEMFQRGEDMISILNQLPYDKTLKKFLLTGNSIGSTQSLLSEYIVITEKKFFLSLGKYVKSIQLVVYLIIGIFVITLYRLLLIPMQSLTF